MFCEVKSCVFVRNKFIIKMFLTSNRCFWLRKLVLYIAFSSESIVSPESGEKYSQIKQHLQVKTVQNSSNFDTGESVIMDLARNKGF